MRVSEEMNLPLALWQEVFFYENGGRKLESRGARAPKGTSISSGHHSSPLAEEPPPEPEVLQVTHTSDGVNRPIPSQPPPDASCFLDKIKSDYILYRFENKV